MPDPFGITQVDIPGIYGAVQNARMGRIQQMLGERQVQAADRQAERENAFNMRLPALFAPRPAAGSTQTSSSSSAAPAQNPIAAAYGGVPPGPAQPAVTPPGLPGANPAGAPAIAPSTEDQSLRMDPEVARQLLTIDPARAGPMIAQLRTLDNDRITQLNAANGYLAREGQRILQLPESQWHQELVSRIPDLLAHGVTQEQIQNFQLNRSNIEYVVNQAQDIDHLIAAARPDLMVAPQGSAVLDRNRVGQTGANGQPVNPVVYESPVVTGPGGEPYARPQSMSQLGQAPPQPGEVRQTSRGPMRFRGGDYRNPANYDPVQGGAPPPNAAGTFPRQDGGAFDFNQRPPSG